MSAPMDPEGMVEAFAVWAGRTGLLDRITSQQCADYAAAFMAGWVIGQVMTLEAAE